MRTLFRPFLTTALLAIVVWMFGDLLAVLGGEEGTLEVLGVDTALELVEYIVVSVVFLSSTAGMCWFGERAFLPGKLK